MTLDFMIYAVLSGLGIAVVAGPLGSLIIWRRMANFGDALGHSTLLGVGLAFLFHVHLYIGLFAVLILFSYLITSISDKKLLSMDTVLSILAQTALALGLIIASILPSARLDLLEYLYGDILAITVDDLIVIALIDILVLGLLFKYWRGFLASTIHEELARVEGVPVAQLKWIYLFIIALVFSIAMKLVGVLLITALFLLPAATARKFSRTPEQMAFLASLFGMIAVGAGILLSLYADWPTGPSIVCAAFGLFLCSLILKPLSLKRA